MNIKSSNNNALTMCLTYLKLRLNPKFVGWSIQIEDFLLKSKIRNNLKIDQEKAN